MAEQHLKVCKCRILFIHMIVKFVGNIFEWARADFVP